MAFLSGLIESFVPTLAFADNEESTVVDNSTRSTIESTPESTTLEGKGENKEGDAKPTTPDPEVSKKKSQEDEPKEEPKPESNEEKVEAEEPKEEAKEEEPKEESSEEETPAEESSEGDDEEEEEDDEEDDEDEDEDEEGGDPLDQLREDCAQQPSIKPYVHHYQECVERVTKEQEEPGYDEKHYKEDCVEEFFHLQHHLNDCVAPRLFSKLK